VNTSIPELEFKNWLVQEGHWDAIKAGFKAGCRAYKDTRKKDEKQKLITKLLDSKDKKSEDSAAAELVAHGHRKRREENLVKWMLEHEYSNGLACLVTPAH